MNQIKQNPVMAGNLFGPGFRQKALAQQAGRAPAPVTGPSPSYRGQV